VKPAPFAYERPADVASALELLAAPGAKAIAGGQSLVPMMAMRLVKPALLVDISGIDGLAGVAAANGHVDVGATTRQRDLERWPELGSRLPLVALALPWVGHRETRNRGTVGGSIVHADPAAELLLVAATLEASVTVRGAGERTVAASELATGPFQTQVGAGELLTGIRFPAASAGDGFAFEEVARRHGDFALCGVAVSLRREGDAVARARVGMLGVGATPVVHSLEGVAPGDFDDAAADLAGRIEPSDDMHASAGYRRRLARVLTARCLERAYDDAGQRGDA
jgi:2-furoyl-CoA dehydrogenase FAD binding subunit